MAAPRTTTERKVSDLQVGDIVALHHLGVGAMVTQVEVIDEDLSRVFILVTTPDEEVVETQGAVVSNHTVEVYS